MPTRPGRAPVRPARGSRRLGHAKLDTTSIYLQGIDLEEISMAVRASRANDVRQRPCSSDHPR
jgi:hypothetical protein